MKKGPPPPPGSRAAPPPPPVSAAAPKLRPFFWTKTNSGDVWKQLHTHQLRAMQVDALQKLFAMTPTTTVKAGGKSESLKSYLGEGYANKSLHTVRRLADTVMACFRFVHLKGFSNLVGSHGRDGPEL